MLEMIWLVLGGLFLLGGLAAVVLGLNEWRNAQASMAWPPAPGRMLVIKTKEKSDGEGGASYFPDVLYEYDVFGRSYTGNRIAFGLEISFPTKSMALGSVSQYGVGYVVMVHYDPKHPDVSVLEQRCQNLWASISIGLLFAAIGSATLCEFFLSHTEMPHYG